MVNLYADLIMNGQRTLEQVPARWREAVREELIRRGFINE